MNLELHVLDCLRLRIDGMLVVVSRAEPIIRDGGLFLRNPRSIVQCLQRGSVLE